MSIKNCTKGIVFPFLLLCNLSFGQKLLIKENIFTPESEENIIYNAFVCIGFQYPGDTAKFNSDGRITYYNSGSRISEFSYYPNGLLEKKTENTSYNSDGSNDSYEYDLQGNITKHENYLSYAWESHYATEIDEYEYRDWHLISSLKYFIDLSYNSSEIGASKDSVRTNYFYDSSNLLVKEEEFHTLYMESNKQYQYFYDKKGNLLSIKTYKLSDNTLQESVTYAYDKDGNIVSREVTDDITDKESYKYENGKMIQKSFKDFFSLNNELTTYKYEYDKYGNVLKVMKYSSDGKKFLSDVCSRKYQYINE